MSKPKLSDNILSAGVHGVQHLVLYLDVELFFNKLNNIVKLWTPLPLVQTAPHGGLEFLIRHRQLLSNNYVDIGLDI